MGKDSDDLQLREYLLEKGFLKERSGKEERKEEIEARLIKEQKAADAKKKILKSYILKGNKNCYVYGIRKVNKCRICGNTDLKLVSIPFKGKSNRHYNARYCIKCKRYYLSYRVYLAHKDDWNIINDQELPALEKEYQNKQATPTNNKKVKKEAVKRIPHEQKSSVITAHDFVVRQNVFKCRYEGHSLQDIQAIISTISSQGEISKITVSAGYCPNCNTYFILESTYNRIKNSGIPICRTIDGKTYMNNLYAGSDSLFGKMAAESVLMQFGYSVSQANNLPVKQRRKILAAIVDYKVLTKSEVISYLDSFINTRKRQKNSDGTPRYVYAISCWQEDRNWLQEYNKNTFKEVNVKKIITNK